MQNVDGVGFALTTISLILAILVMGLHGRFFSTQPRDGQSLSSKTITSLQDVVPEETSPVCKVTAEAQSPEYFYDWCNDSSLNASRWPSCYPNSNP